VYAVHQRGASRQLRREGGEHDPTGSTLALGAAGSDALAGLLAGMHHDGYLIALVFFGLWLLPLGYLVVRSGYFPKSWASC
jgi:hypothetical protein